MESQTLTPFEKGKTELLEAFGFSYDSFSQLARHFLCIIMNSEAKVDLMAFLLEKFDLGMLEQKGVKSLADSIPDDRMRELTLEVVEDSYQLEEDLLTKKDATSQEIAEKLVYHLSSKKEEYQVFIFCGFLRSSLFPYHPAPAGIDIPGNEIEEIVIANHEVLQEIMFVLSSKDRYKNPIEMYSAALSILEKLEGNVKIVAFSIISHFQERQGRRSGNGISGLLGGLLGMAAMKKPDCDGNCADCSEEKKKIFH